MRVRLREVAEAIGFGSDHIAQFLDKEKGEVVELPQEALSAVEDSESPEETEGLLHEEDLTLAEAILTEDRFVKLPWWDEWSVMDDFASTREDLSLRSELHNATRGRGAFRYFKDVVRQRGVKEDWRQFRDEALRDYAREWLEAEGIPYVE